MSYSASEEFFVNLFEKSIVLNLDNRKQTNCTIQGCVYFSVCFHLSEALSTFRYF